MKSLIISFLVVLSLPVVGQSLMEADSIANSMCQSLAQLKSKNDTLLINELYEKEFYPYLRQFESAKAEKIADRIYFRMQRNCTAFRDLLDRLNPPQNAFVRVSKKPKPEIDKSDLKKFKKQKNFHYLEPSGALTKVKMNKGEWVDTFTDGTFSKLTYQWNNETEFELIFENSNNLTRKNFSLKGDRYVYQVLSKMDGYYYISVNIPGQDIFEKFKLFYK